MSCVLFYPQLAYLLSQFQYFVCPVGFNSETNGFTVECEPSDIFVMQEYTLPAVVQNTLRWVRLCPFHSFNFKYFVLTKPIWNIIDVLNEIFHYCKHIVYVTPL